MGTLFQFSSSSFDTHGSPITSLPAIVADSPGRVIYVPNLNVNGVDSLQYYARDTKGADPDVTRLSIDITSVNQLPSVSSTSVMATTLGDQSKNITLAATDPDDELFNYVILSRVGGFSKITIDGQSLLNLKQPIEMPVTTIFSSTQTHMNWIRRVARTASPAGSLEPGPIRAQPTLQFADAVPTGNEVIMHVGLMTVC